MADDRAAVIAHAAERIIAFRRFHAERLARSRSRSAEEKHTGESHRPYEGLTLEDVLNEYTDDQRLWCKLAEAANQLALDLEGAAAEEVHA